MKGKIDKTERLTVRVPRGWNNALAKIAVPMERDRSYLTRKALEKAHPELRDITIDHIDERGSRD